MPIESRPTVVITGCSEGGLGEALCHAFHQHGFYVFATVRNLDKAAALRQEGIEVLRLDNTVNETIQQCAKYIRDKTRDTLDVLVNNAGVLAEGPLLDLSVDDGRKTFDVNVWGMIAVTQAFAPLLLKSKGAILNISSIGGAIPLVWQGVYNGSKAAQTLLSETLRLEMEPWGVRVITAMVGEVQTKIYTNTSHVNLPEGSLYTPVQQYIADQGAGKFAKKNEPASKTAENLVRDVLSRKSGQIWRGGSAGTARLMTTLLPDRVRDQIVHSGRGLDKLGLPKE